MYIGTFFLFFALSFIDMRHYATNFIEVFQILERVSASFLHWSRVGLKLCTMCCLQPPSLEKMNGPVQYYTITINGSAFNMLDYPPNLSSYIERGGSVGHYRTAPCRLLYIPFCHCFLSIATSRHCE